MQPNATVENPNPSLQVLDPAAILQGATALEITLAWFHHMLEKKYKSGSDPRH
jgi:hypothetical protein